MNELNSSREEALTDTNEPESRPGFMDSYLSLLKRAKSREKDPQKVATWKRLGHPIAQLFGRRQEVLAVPRPPIVPLPLEVPPPPDVTTSISIEAPKPPEQTADEEKTGNEVEVRIPHEKKAPEVPPPLDLAEIIMIENEEAKDPETSSTEKSPETVNPKESDIQPIDPEAVEVTIEHLPEQNEFPEEELPEELQNELRHERKGENTLQETTEELASSVGEILENLKNKTALAHNNFTKSAPASSGLLSDRFTKTPLANLTPLYQKAVLSGFGTALFILIVWALISLVR